MFKKRIIIAGFVVTGSILLASSAMSAINCAANPFRHECCPQPCPIDDLKKTGELVHNLGNMATQLESETLHNAQLDTILNEIGLEGIDSNLLLSTFADEQLYTMPLLGKGDISDVADIRSSWLRQEDDDQTLRAEKEKNADAQLKKEASDAFALVQHFREEKEARNEAELTALVNLPSDVPLRTSWQNNTAVRQSLLPHITNINQLLSLWLGLKSLREITVLNRAKNDPILSMVENPYDYIPSDLPPNIQAQLAELYRALQEAVTIHNYRVDAQGIMQGILVLEETVENHNAAIANRTSTFENVEVIAQTYYRNPESTAVTLENTLRAKDNTAFTDNYRRQAAAKSASDSVIGVMDTKPDSYGDAISSPLNLSESSENMIAAQFVRHLDSIKIEEYWRPLRDSAELRIEEALNQLDYISNELEVPILENQALAKEKTALEGFYTKASQPDFSTVDAKQQNFYSTLIQTAQRLQADSAATTIITLPLGGM